jgi:L-seryl-tRNA(Ser) seleniumtransferase
MSEKAQLLRQIPQVDVLARREDLSSLLEQAGRGLGMRLLRGLLDHWRRRILDGSLSGKALQARLDDLPGLLQAEIEAALRSSLVPLINATGVVVHTNLGRAVLCPAARRAAARIGAGYSNLEYDLDQGRRGSRLSHLDRSLEQLFPGQMGMAVNNNAGAVLLALNTLAAGKEVIVSRGELVEIGGSFRIPEIMEKSGAILREVGTTNRTRIGDYREAVGPQTGVLLKVHPSNYRILGFAEETSLAELAELGHERGLPVLMDQGAGNLVDLSAYGVNEPPVSALLDDGADLVLFSGDKLLGGPQAGVAVGRPDLVEAMRRNPMARALRLDKATLSALEATLGEYVRGTAVDRIPVLRMVSQTAEEIGTRAGRLREALEGRVEAELELRDGGSVVGGGAWPLGELPTRLVALTPRRGGAGELERALRSATPPVVARVEEGRVLLDLRTVLPEEEEFLEEVLVRALGG